MTMMVEHSQAGFERAVRRLVGAAEVGTLDGLLAGIRALSGGSVAVLSPEGTTLARSEGAGIPGRVTEHSVHHLGRPIATLALDGGSLEPLILDLARRLVAEQLARALAREEGRRRLATTVLSDVIYGYTTERESLHRLAGLDIDVTQQFRVVIVQQGAGSETALATAPLHVRLPDHDAEVPAIPFEGSIVVIVPDRVAIGDEKRRGKRLGGAVLERFSTTGHDTRIGVSHAHLGTAGVRIAYHEATTAAERGPGVRLAALIDLPLALVSSRVVLPVAQLARAALDPLITYDERNDGQLMSTLRMYLENDRNTVQTAERMFLHRSTVRYRLAKISELLTVDLDDSQTIATLWLALVALKHSPDDSVGESDEHPNSTSEQTAESSPRTVAQ